MYVVLRKLSGFSRNSGVEFLVNLGRHLSMNKRLKDVITIASRQRVRSTFLDCKACFFNLYKVTQKCTHSCVIQLR